MMVFGCVVAWLQLPAPWQWTSGPMCGVVAAWLWSLPTRQAGRR
jgi:hypothetical protein